MQKNIPFDVKNIKSPQSSEVFMEYFALPYSHP